MTDKPIGDWIMRIADELARKHSRREHTELYELLNPRENTA